MDKQRILVVEDDPAIRRGVVHSLRFNGYAVVEAADEAAGRAAAAEAFDLLLLDLNLPGGDGLEILKAVRERSASVPVIILTARGDEGDRVKGLKLGADDYVVKPFGALELLARIEAVLRRSPSRPADALLIPVGWWHAVQALDVSLSVTFVCFDRAARNAEWRDYWIGPRPGKVER